MTPDEIRAEAIERIARADYTAWLERVRDVSDRWDEPCEHRPWDEAPDEGEWGRDHWRRIHAPTVDALEQADHLARGKGWQGGNLLPSRAQWAAVHEEFTDFDELPEGCIYDSREEAQQQLDSWQGPGRIVRRLLTEWEEDRS